MSGQIVFSIYSAGWERGGGWKNKGLRFGHGLQASGRTMAASSYNRSCCSLRCVRCTLLYQQTRTASPCGSQLAATRGRGGQRVQFESRITCGPAANLILQVSHTFKSSQPEKLWLIRGLQKESPWTYVYVFACLWIIHTEWMQWSWLSAEDLPMSKTHLQQIIIEGLSRISLREQIRIPERFAVKKKLWALLYKTTVCGA